MDGAITNITSFRCKRSSETSGKPKNNNITYTNKQKGNNVLI